jgi:hypothetical protein
LYIKSSKPTVTQKNIGKLNPIGLSQRIKHVIENGIAKVNLPKQGIK